MTWSDSAVTPKPEATKVSLFSSVSWEIIDFIGRDTAVLHVLDKSSRGGLYPSKSSGLIFHSSVCSPPIRTFWIFCDTIRAGEERPAQVLLHRLSHHCRGLPLAMEGVGSPFSHRVSPAPLEIPNAPLRLEIFISEMPLL